MRENQFQKKLIGKIKSELPDAIVIKNDPNYIQGIPDLIVLYGSRWAALECKKDEKAAHRPNQDYYVNLMRKMSYASFIDPSNEEEIISELLQALGAKKRGTRTI
jgi:hypothetical protein